MNGLSKGTASGEAVTWTEVDEAGHEQRVDNYLLRRLKGVPKSHVYRILRSGEVRVNSKRVDASYRLQQGDKVRIPPVRVARRPAPVTALPAGPRLPILFEDRSLLAIDKPPGLAVHGGSGVSLGAIERLRRERPQEKFLELVHRIDRETSGVLLLAKKRSALTALHAQIRQGSVGKRYQTLVLGAWQGAKRSVQLPLQKFVTRSGERRVVVDEAGDSAHTVFRLLSAWPQFTLLEAELKTGRTHQIRVHLAHLGFPVAGDDKYGDFSANKVLARRGLKRMFLHSWKLAFHHPEGGERVEIESPLAPDLKSFVETLDQDRNTDSG
jgi:23S rRNA pseudouridine955/2504/2580 synthase